MNRFLRPAGFPARWLVSQLLVMARDTFEASVAIHYDAPWQQSASTRCVSSETAS